MPKIREKNLEKRRNFHEGKRKFRGKLKFLEKNRNYKKRKLKIYRNIRNFDFLLSHFFQCDTYQLPRSEIIPKATGII